MSAVACGWRAAQRPWTSRPLMVKACGITCSLEIAGGERRAAIGVVTLYAVALTMKGGG